MDILDSNLLNSDWLIHMLKKSSTKPSMRLLSLFDILEDWLDAPTVREQFSQQSLHKMQFVDHKLQDFLTIEAAKAGAAMPEMLASQLYFMAVAACQEKLNHKYTNSNSAQINSIQANSSLTKHSLIHAKSAAKALIAAQTAPEYRISKTSAYAIAASFFGALVVTGSLFIFNQTHPLAPKIAYIKPSNAIAKADLIASPEQTSALIAQIDQMRKGNCQLIEALQLPDSYKKVYFENIVSGQISTNLEDQKLVHQMLDMVRCNYTPMLMANSKG